MDGDELLALIAAIESARASLDPLSEARFILDGVLLDVLNDLNRDIDNGYDVVDIDDLTGDDISSMRGVIFDNVIDAADYLDQVPIGGTIVSLGEGFFGVLIERDSR